MSFQSIYINRPGIQSSTHTCIYLPTAGKNCDFVNSLADLDVHISDLKSKYPDSAHFIRGDANSSMKNVNRHSLLTNFYTDLSFLRVPIQHNTYHHFVGNGVFDSELDVILYCRPETVKESLVEVICKVTCPLLSSHHDILLTSFTLPRIESPSPSLALNKATRVENKRSKIFWSDQGMKDYELLVSEHLPYVRDLWGNSSSPTSVSILLASTYEILVSAAKATNQYVSLASDPPVKNVKKGLF